MKLTRTMTPEEVTAWEEKLRDGTLFGSPMEVTCSVCGGTGRLDTLVSVDILERGRRIIEETAGHFGMTVMEIISASRQPRLVEARRFAARRMKDETTLTWAAIGQLLGGRGHATIVNLLRPKQLR